MNRLALVVLLTAGALPVVAHDPITTKLTWTQEISRIVYKRCASCHRDFSAYEGARPWAKAIRDEVESRRMPPWGAVPGIGDFLGDPALSTPEIDMLVAWVEGGAPEGDPAYLSHRVPAPEPAVRMPWFSESATVRKELILKRSARLVALKPYNLQDHGSLEAWTLRPDGQVDRLIWLNDYRRAWTRNYIMREPAVMPAGTRLRVSGAPGSALTLFLR